MAIKGATLTAPKMPVPEIAQPKEASVEDWNKQFKHLELLGDLESTLTDNPQGRVILYDLSRMHIDNFKCWYFERRSRLADDHIQRLIEWSIYFNDLFDDKNGKVLEMGLDTILASIFRSLERDLKEYKPATVGRLKFKQEIEVHRNWAGRLPSSCPTAKKALNRLFKYIDEESNIQVPLFSLWA